MRCFYCLKEALSEFYDMPDDDIPVVFTRDVAEEILNDAPHTGKVMMAIEEFVKSRSADSFGLYPSVITDEENKTYVVPTCFTHWFNNQ